MGARRWNWILPERPVASHVKNKEDLWPGPTVVSRPQTVTVRDKVHQYRDAGSDSYPRLLITSTTGCAKAHTGRNSYESESYYWFSRIRVKRLLACGLEHQCVRGLCTPRTEYNHDSDDLPRLLLRGYQCCYLGSQRDPSANVTGTRGSTTTL
eukprot:660075-Rhodomonas_salina.1